ncbi:MAG: hypothetical protein FIA95_06315 [Gemmatimonadetes bacterium]|nr:hypothetical protein [Gemmatimonadota bacterium]
MSRRRSRCRAVALAVALAAAGPASAQQTEQDLTRYLDSLLPLLPEARARSLAAQAAARRAREILVATDTVPVGPLTVLVVPGEAEAALDVVGGVWRSEYAPWLDASPALAADRIFFQWSAKLVEYRSADFNVRVVQGARWHPRAYMEQGVRQVLSRSLMGDLLGTRLATDWGVPGVRPPEDPSHVYRQAVLAPSRAARACLAGVAASCLAACGLNAPDAPLSERYTPEERRFLVRRNAARLGRAGTAAHTECAEGSAAACDRVLDSYLERYGSAQNRLWSVPFGADLRASLLWFALFRGGEGAWGRLLAHADDEPLAALEAASGRGADALMLEWRAWLLQGRPVQHAGLGAQAVTGSLWILLLIALAARSTRWRFG